MTQGGWGLKAVTFVFGVCSVLTVSAAGYHVTKRIPIAGDMGWDYVTADAEGRRLYVPHDSEVVVLDLDTGAVVATITGLAEAHGVAVARDVGRGYISASDPGSVVVFDLKSNAILERIRVGDDPNGIIYEPSVHRVYTADRGSRRMTAIDVRTNKVVATSGDLGGRTEHLAADGAGHVFLNMQDRGTLLRLDASELKVQETWTLGSCGQPSSMDMDVKNGRVFIGCRSGLMTVVDGASGRIVATAPIGPGVDAMEFDAGRRLLFVSTGGDGVLSVFRADGPDQYVLAETVTTLPGARTLTVDRKTGVAYLPVADRGPTPPATADNPRPRPTIKPGTFSVLVVTP